MVERTPQNQDKYVVRFPDGLRDRIRDAAAANNRSMNAEIVATLERAYPPPRAPITVRDFIHVLEQVGRAEQAQSIQAAVDDGSVELDDLVEIAGLSRSGPMTTDGDKMHVPTKVRFKITPKAGHEAD